jgi:hypothetical protein
MNEPAARNGAKVPTVDFETCIFCELVAGRLPISVIDETDDVLALMDIQPGQPRSFPRNSETPTAPIYAKKAPSARTARVRDVSGGS